MSAPRIDFDIYDPALVATPGSARAAIGQLAVAGPVAWSARHGGHWVISGYPEIQQVLRDPNTFSSWPNNIVPRGTEKLIPVDVDPPEHGAYRQSMQRLFGPARMRALEDDIRSLVVELIDEFAGRGQAEFVAEFAHPLPARVFLALMGWPLEDAPLFTKASDAILLGKPGGTEAESNAVRQEAAAQLYGYFSQVVSDRRARPRNDVSHDGAGHDGGDSGEEDVTAAIMAAPIELDGESRQLSDAELCNMFFLLLLAGLHTTQGSLAWSLMHLAAHPQQRDRLVADPTLVPSAVEEILRIEAAVAPGRRVTQDTVLAGVPMREGDTVLLMLAGANIDAREFDDPDALQLDRTPNRHLSFGSGPHRCLGSHLARVELRIALEELHRRIPDYRVAAEAVQHPSQVRGVVSLPITFTPESRP